MAVDGPDDTAFSNSQTQSLAAQMQNGDTVTKSFRSIKFPTSNHEEETGGMNLTFTEYKYSRPSRDTDYKPIPTGTNISLPLPRELSTTYSADWNNVEMGAFGQVLSDSMPGIAGKITTAWNKGAWNTLSDIYDGAKSLLDPKKQSSMDMGLGKFGSALGTDMLTNNSIFKNATTGIGVARNPFLAAQFEGVQFRTFPFQWDLVPRSQQDTDTIEKLIKAFKYGMLPSYVELGSLKNALFRYPYIYKPKFTKNKYLFDFGMCVIKDFSVNYHGHGKPVYSDSNGDKAPMYVTISITLQEIEINTKETVDTFNDFSGSSRGR